MSETHNSAANGRAQRRSLSSELDRFDQMIDGLDQAIREVIADGFKESVRPAIGDAVRATLLDLVMNPESLGMVGGENLATAVRQPAEDTTNTKTRPTVFQRLGNNLAEFRLWIAAKLRTLGQGLAWPFHKMSEVCPSGSRRPIVGALLIGLLVGCLSTAGAPWIAAIISGLGAMGAAVGAQMIQWKRRMFAPAPAR